MKFLSALIMCSLICSCGPRDDEKLANGGQGNQKIKSGSTLVVTAQDGMLSTCNKSVAEAWSDIRMFPELSYLSDKTDQFKAVVSKGINCSKVSSQETVEIVFKDESGGFNGTGSYFYITKIEAMNTKDFLKDEKRVSEVAKDMAMTSDQLKDYINAEPYKDQVSVTYLKPADGQNNNGGSTTPVEEDPSESEYSWFKLPEAEGKTASDCKGGELVWTSMRVYLPTQSFVNENLLNRKITAYVEGGDFNCLAIGAEAAMTFQNAKGGYDLNPSLKFKVRSVLVRNKSNLLNDPILRQTVAEEMGLGEEKFVEYLGTLKGDKVNTTRIEWIEE